MKTSTDSEKLVYSFKDWGTIGAHFPDVKMAVGYRENFSFIGYNEGGLIIGNHGGAFQTVRG